MKPSTTRPPAARRLAAEALGAVLGALAISLARGSEPQPWGAFLRDGSDLLLRDLLGFASGAAVVGAVTPLVAGNHVPGLPLRALALSWVLAVFLPPGFDVSVASRRRFQIDGSAAATVELLVLAVAVGIATTVCWLVDTRVTFPRIHPDPADRPPAKHTSRRDLMVLLVPHLVGVAALVGAVGWGVASARRALFPQAAVVVAAVAATVVMQRLRPARGSIWTALGVLGGVAVCLVVAARFVQSGGDYPWLGGRPALLFVSGIMLWLALVARDATPATAR